MKSTAKHTFVQLQSRTQTMVSYRIIGSDAQYIDRKLTATIEM